MNYGIIIIGDSMKDDLIKKLSESKTIEEATSVINELSFLLGPISGTNAIVKGICGINDENLKFELIKDDNIYPIAIVKTLPDNLKIKYLQICKKESIKVEIINLFNDEQTRLDLLQYLSTDWDKYNVIKKLSDEYKAKSLEFIDDLGTKTGIIELLSNEEIRFEFIKQIINNPRISIVRISKMLSDEYKVKLINLMDDDSNKEFLIESLQNEDIKFTLLSYLKKSMSRYDVVNTLPDDLKVKALNKFDENDDKYWIINIINSINDEEWLIEAFKSLNNLETVKRCLSQRDDKIKLKALSLFEQDDIKMIISTMSDDNYIIASLKFVTTVQEQIEVISYIKDEKTRNTQVLNIPNYKDILLDCFNDYKYEYISKFNYEIITDVFNPKQIRILEEYDKLSSEKIKNIFIDFIRRNYNNIDIEKISDISNILFRINISNSSEIRNLGDSIALLLLDTINPIESFNLIEEVFVSNNLPTVGKIYNCFNILHPNFSGFDFRNASPVLKYKSTFARETIVFSDLIKSALGSNNKSLISYINTLENGNKIYEKILNENIPFNSLNDNGKQEITNFYHYLQTLYNNTTNGRKNPIIHYNSENIIKGITELKILLSPDATKSTNYNLPDRAIKMFCHFAGFNTVEQAKTYLENKKTTAEERGIKISNIGSVELNIGDLIKGIGSINYLSNILNNGSVSKEYLGADATSDRTPLDTDVSMILHDGDFDQKIDNSISKNYGPIWFVLKNDDRFTITRDDDKEIRADFNLNKLELFKTGVLGDDHYGIRTGFASSDIDYIISDPYDSRIELELVMNGFYIPVVNKNGEVKFKYEDYLNLKNKTNGLKYYGNENYNLADNIKSSDIDAIASTLVSNDANTKRKRDAIVKSVKDAMAKIGLEVRENISNDLKRGYIEFIDTGSTGRGTNVPDDSDFDFMLKMDQDIIANKYKLNKLKEELISQFDEIDEKDIANGNFRFKGVKIKGLDKKVDIDITFEVKNDKVTYSTDMCVKDRLNSIKEQHPKEYNSVIANIIKAKEILKENKCYKPYRSDRNQGGLGGVGVENWILQNGGSLEQAAATFISAAIEAENENKLSANNSIDSEFNLFIKKYKIYDFGENHMANTKNTYLHDEFIYNNMSVDGYKKMKNILKEYLLSINNIDQNQNDDTYNIAEEKLI